MLRKTLVRPRMGRTGGFSLVELVVVLAVLGIAMAIGLPAFWNFVLRNQLLAATRETAVLLQKARLEAIRRSQPTVVRPDFDQNALVAFVNSDVDGAGLYPDLDLDPATEIILGKVNLPSRIRFWGPADAPPNGTDANTFPGPVATPAEAPAPPFVADLEVPGAVFLSNGSAVTEGAFRFADQEGRNFLEVRLAPRGTAHFSIRKYRASGPIAGETWYESATDADGNKTWEWR